VSLSGPKRKRWILPAAGLGVILVVVIAIGPERTPLPSAYEFSPGTRLSYEIEYGTSSEADFRSLFEDTESFANLKEQAPPHLAQSTGTLLRGVLLMTLLESGPDGLLCAYRLAHPRVRLEINGSDAPSHAESVTAALGRDVFVKTSRQGRVLGVLFGPEADRLAKGFTLALLSQIQFVLPGGSRSGSGAWDAEEEGPNGCYLARYTKTDPFGEKSLSGLPKGLRAFRKTKTEYRSAGAEDQALLLRLPTTISPEGVLNVLFDAKGGYVESMSGSETERISVSGREVARVDSSLSIQHVSTESIPFPELSEVRLAFAALKPIADFVPLTVAISEEESELAIQRTALGQATLDSLLEEMELAETENQERNTGLYLKFKALVYLHPEMSSTLGDLLADSPPESLAWDVVAGALGAVGHPEAQAALVGLIRTKPDETRLVSGLVQSLAMVRFPSEQAERALRELAENATDDSIRSGALFGLGSMSRRLRELEPGRAGKIVDGLQSLIRASISEMELDTVLKALGNSGSKKALPIFRKYTKHPSGSLRAAAAAGLRFVEAAEAERVLVKLLGSDPEDSVRSAALLAFSFREPTRGSMKAHLRAVTKDRSESVRLAALRNLGGMIRDFPEVLVVIRRVAEEDSSENVRESADALLRPS
jgi:HEAT repeat protein